MHTEIEELTYGNDYLKKRIPPLPSVSWTSDRRLRKRDSLLTVKGEGGGRGAES